jgi:glycosyltransferase involved in cell wall biosynthesis
MSEAEVARTVMIIMEKLPESSPPGVRRRFEHVEVWAQRRGLTVEVEALIHETQKRHKMQRLLMTIRKAIKPQFSGPRPDLIIVLGLGAPHMLIYAIRLVGRADKMGIPVIFDACDSWLQQLRSRLKAGQNVLSILPILAGASIQIIAPYRLRLSYISKSDKVSDSIISLLKKRIVIPPTADQRLALLDPVSSSVKRIVVSADYESFHNQKGLRILAEAWAISRHQTTVGLHFFGKGSLPLDQFPGAIWHGWAEDITEVYEGATVVFVPNIGGSGVPNKLLEAGTAGRPVIVHDESKLLDHNKHGVFRYTSASDLAKIIRALGDLSVLDNT